MWYPIKNCSDFEINNNGLVRDCFTKEGVEHEPTGSVFIYDDDGKECEIDPATILRDLLSGSKDSASDTKTIRSDRIEVLDTLTGITTTYKDINECSSELNLSRDTLEYRLSLPVIYKWDDCKAFRYEEKGVPWPKSIRFRKSGTVRTVSHMVEVLYTDTGETFKFNSMSEAASVLGITTAGVAYRAKSNGKRVYENRLRCRLYKGERPWPDIAPNARSRDTSCKSVQIRDIRSKKIYTFSKMADVSCFLNRTRSWISKNIHAGEWVIYDSKYQMRLDRGDAPWDDTL